MHAEAYRTSRISDIVNRHPGAIRVFERFHIDFCCNGNLQLAEACQRANVKQEQVVEELMRSINETSNPNIRVQDWSLDLLANYITQNHHQYVRTKILDIRRLISSVSTKHAFQHPELHEMKRLFEALSRELEIHMDKEENVLFPAVTLLSMKSGATAWDDLEPLLATTSLEEDHELAGEYLKTIRLLSKNYTPPADACNSYKLLYKMLIHFEEDLHIHIHLENNLLFPKALQLQNHLIEKMNNLN